MILVYTWANYVDFSRVHSKGLFGNWFSLKCHLFTFWYYRHLPRQMLGGGFKYFIFSPQPGEGFHFDWYFFKGLKPPTRGYIHMNINDSIDVRYQWLFCIASLPKTSETDWSLILFWYSMSSCIFRATKPTTSPLRNTRNTAEITLILFSVCSIYWELTRLLPYKW